MVLNKEEAHSQAVVNSLMEDMLQVVVHILIEEDMLQVVVHSLIEEAALVEGMVSSLAEDNPIINNACLFCMGTACNRQLTQMLCIINCLNIVIKHF